MGFGEFASFTCQLDDDTIKEHVTAMVGVSGRCISVKIKIE